MKKLVTILFAFMLPIAVDAANNINVVFVPTPSISPSRDDTTVDYDKMRKWVGSCYKVWQSKYSWDYIVRCKERPELVAISKKAPNSRFVSIPKTDKEFAKLAKPNRILVNVNPLNRHSRDGEIITCYRVMSETTNLENLTSGPYAIEVCG